MPTSEARSINANPPLREALPAFARMAAMTVKAEPVRVLLLAALQVTKDLCALAVVVTIAAFVDRVSDGSTDEAVVVRLLVLGAISQGLGWSAFGLGQAVLERVAHVMEQRVLDLVAGIPTIAHHELPEFQNEVELLRWQAVWLGAIANRLVGSVSSVVRVVGTLILLASVHPLLSLLALAGVPAVAVARSQQRLHQDVTEAVVEPRRLVSALIDTATSASVAKEVRVFGLGPVLEGRYREAQTDIDARLDAATTRSAGLQILVRVLFGICFGAALIAVARMASRGDASVGDLLLTAGLAAQLTGHLSDASSSVGPIRDAAVAACRFSWLEDYAANATATMTPARPAPVPPSVRRAIQLDHVSFRYPNTDRPVLHDVSFELPAGATVAIVGENGAGKTTLVKLLTRMYVPTGGRILVDDIDLADMDPLEWRRRTSAAFQDHARFEVLLREAVGIGNAPDITNDHVLVDALARATADDLIGGPIAGLSSQLGRMFRGGVELSIGQWQKVALARGLVRDAPLLLALDEPTSALDPLAERRLFDGFASAARASGRAAGGVTLLVSHRFSTVRTADLVVVLRAGAVEEVGTHHELMARAGTYHELYELQARAYR